ncbi:hypothetical protein E2C01_064236 [Portunus trituberculatus]|uniref:Uncharacterized protein n=1 Tax=Portunus trituberculatus TaxID=210409 RepID=A0A5B7HFQ3_PORTR|nr:hypothetical protein [Portunus trituberculatus]
MLFISPAAVHPFPPHLPSTTPFPLPSSPVSPSGLEIITFPPGRVFPGATHVPYSCPFQAGGDERSIVSRGTPVWKLRSVSSTSCFDSVAFPGDACRVRSQISNTRMLQRRFNIPVTGTCATF